MLAVRNGSGQEIDPTASHIANLNPIRYRSYYYDTETGFYYLQTRYYDPATGRFVNADGYMSTGQGFAGYNMYAYCGNNPVMLVDPSGEINIFFQPLVVFTKKNIEVIVTVCMMSTLNNLGFSDTSYSSANDCYDTLVKNGIDTPQEKAHFFSQCYVEGNVSLLEAGYLDEESAEYYRKSKKYYPYYGAGYIQLTWDYNYKAFSEYMNDPLIYSEGAKYVAANYAWSAAGWFWTNNNINDLIANGGTVSDVTYKVNGGQSQLSERTQYYYSFLSYFGG